MSSPNSSALQLKYERQYDLLSVWLGSPQVVDSIEVEPGLCVRVSRETHRVVGLEVVEAAARFHKEPRVLETPAFAQSLLDEYGPLALSHR